MEIFKDFFWILIRIVKICIEEFIFFVDENLIKFNCNFLRLDKVILGLKFYIKINREKNVFKKYFLKKC